MLTASPAVERLMSAFRKLPGVGRKTAERYVLHLLAMPPEETREFGCALQEAREKISRCPECGNLTEESPCIICADSRRDRSLLCIVEQPSGAMAIEKGGTYRGGYHVLHGVLNPLEGVGPEELRIERLMERLTKGEIQEVIIATNATAEGEATALYLARRIGALNIKVTRIAHGVPMGGGVEYADDLTLARAIEGRLQM